VQVFRARCRGTKLCNIWWDSRGGSALSQGGSVLCLAGRSVRKLQEDQIVLSSLWKQQPCEFSHRLDSVGLKASN
jgi:hypothetical protein